MQLEKIRSADTQVRWQDEEDCYQCPSCKQDFTVTRRKVRKLDPFLHYLMMSLESFHSLTAVIVEQYFVRPVAAEW